MKVRLDDIHSGDTVQYFDAKTDEEARQEADCIVAESGRDRELDYEGFLLFEIEKQDNLGDIIKREIEL